VNLDVALTQQAAEAAHAAEVARVEAENARLAEMHAREVEDKLFREEQHRMVGGGQTWGGGGRRGHPSSGCYSNASVVLGSIWW
jgi:hypothetical protein